MIHHWFSAAGSSLPKRRLRRAPRQVVGQSLEERRVLAAAFQEFLDPNPAPGNRFGTIVAPLSTGNVVVTSPFDDAGGIDAGAVYLFNGATGALISTLIGSTASDSIGADGITVLAGGNYLIRSRSWDNGAATNAGAVTFGSGTSGVSGVVSATNSLIGNTSNDDIGGGGITVLSNGNYVVRSPSWDNGAATNAGAVTFGSGITGVSGEVSAANSLVGSSPSDDIGSTAILELSNWTFAFFGIKWILNFV